MSASETQQMGLGSRTRTEQNIFPTLQPRQFAVPFVLFVLKTRIGCSGVMNKTCDTCTMTDNAKRLIHPTVNNYCCVTSNNPDGRMTRKVFNPSKSYYYYCRLAWHIWPCKCVELQLTVILFWQPTHQFSTPYRNLPKSDPRPGLVLCKLLHHHASTWQFTSRVTTIMLVIPFHRIDTRKNGLSPICGRVKTLGASIYEWIRQTDKNDVFARMPSELRIRPRLSRHWTLLLHHHHHHQLLQ
jgi:hypothetical protein